MENWIGPLYVTGGSSNDGLYTNPQVDALYKEGTSAADTEAAHAKFAEATKVIDADTPTMPIYFYTQQSGFSNKVKNGQVTWQGAPDLSSFEIA